MQLDRAAATGLGIVRHWSGMFIDVFFMFLETYYEGCNWTSLQCNETLSLLRFLEKGSQHTDPLSNPAGETEQRPS
jgi:hypothetical protein